MKKILLGLFWVGALSVAFAADKHRNALKAFS
jgi:hypothetical protein